VRIKVSQENDRPVMGLSDTDFQLFVKLSPDQEPEEVIFKPQDWRSPENTVPPPAWIIVLLDMSNSMLQPDSKGQTRIDGAIQAVREFTDLAAERGGNTQISIVPFGEGGASCEGYEVKNETLNQFFLAGDIKLQNYLDYLDDLIPCASTNLYEPLKKAVKFLADGSNTSFYPPENSELPEPRLSVILLSDGYHNRGKEQEEFDDLSELLRRNNQIIVHTLGYGSTPEELGNKYKLGRPATRQDIGVGDKKVPEKEFVDQKRLAEIANLTGGIAEFSGNAEDIAENLQLFLDSLLGEYEITYTDPKPERGVKHDVMVEVQSIKSESEPYTIRLTPPLSVKSRLIMTIILLILLGIGGIIPFYFWGKHLKEEAQN